MLTETGGLLGRTVDGSERRKRWRPTAGTGKAGPVLTEAEIGQFVADGFVAIRDAVPEHVAAACVDVVWAELGELGLEREDRATWTRPLVWIPCPEGGPFVEAGTSPVLWDAYDQLIGPDRWPRRQGVGGHIPVRFPAPVDPGYAGWHFDSGTPREDKTWASVHSPTRALLSLFLFTDVAGDDSPTLLLRGSHVDVASVLGGAGDEGLEWSSLESLRRRPRSSGRSWRPRERPATSTSVTHSWCTGRRGPPAVGPHGSSANRASG